MSYCWTPQPKQWEALKQETYEILYGGARGGGKTDAGQAWLLYPIENENYQGLVIRRNADDLNDWVARAKVMYRSARVRVAGKPAVFTFPSGAKIYTGHLKDADAYEKYQGHEYQRILIEELTHIPRETDYVKLIASCRSTIPGLKAQVFCTTNPGNKGHQWVKARFVDPSPPGKSFLGVEGRTRVFIPARVMDNPALCNADPGYVTSLENLYKSNKGLYEAWFLGSWDYVVGAAFEELHRDTHMIRVEKPPERLFELFDFEKMTPKPGIKIYRSFDWGYAKPFSMGWYFQDYGGADVPPRVYRYREMYGCSKPDVGIKLPTRMIAKKAKQIEDSHNEEITLGVADSSIWDRPGDTREKNDRLPSHAEVCAQEGIYFDKDLSVRAKKDRIQRKGQMHERLRVKEDGEPSFYAFDTCPHFWRTMPVLPTDDLNPEDVDTDTEDHIYDEVSYFLAVRAMQMRSKSDANPFSLESIMKGQDMAREARQEHDMAVRGYG